MFATSFTIQTAHPLPPKFPRDIAVETLHDLESVMLLSPDCRSCKPLPPPPAKPAKKGAAPARQPKIFEVEDNLPLVPKSLWNGGVKYQADFYPIENGCDITVHAPMGFTCVNQWRLKRGDEMSAAQIGQDNALSRVRSKELMHIPDADDDWYVEIVTEAKCPRAFAGVVKGTLKSSHSQLQEAFIQKIQTAPEPKQKRIPLGRRRSSVL